MAKDGTCLWCKQQTDFLYGTCSAKRNCLFASLPGSQILRGKGSWRVVDPVSSAFFPPSINQPQVPLPIFVTWFHWPTSPHSWGGSHYTTAPLHTWGTFMPAAETWGQALVLCTRGPALFLSPVQTFDEAELSNVAHRGQEEWGCHAQDVTLLLASASQVCHTLLEIRKSPAGV